jgi:hypothetical protein
VNIKHEELYECDRCLSTVLSTLTDLTSQWKWKKFAGGKLLLCPDCQPQKR